MDVIRCWWFLLAVDNKFKYRRGYIMLFVVHYYDKNRDKHSVDVEADNHLDAIDMVKSDSKDDWKALIVCQRIKD